MVRSLAVADHRDVLSRRTFLGSLLAALPAFADRKQGKRAAKDARKSAERTQKLARRDVADRKDSGARRVEDRKLLNADNAELDKARRQDQIDLTRRRQAHISRPVVDAPPPAKEPKPGVKPVTRNAAPAPEPKKK